MADTAETARTVLSGAATTTPMPSIGPAVATQGNTVQRTTVLPHLQMEGERPSLALKSRERFEEVAPLGQGGMGEVVLVKDHDIERAVALKRLLPNADLGSMLRFVDEIRIVGSLEHPNIVPVHDVGIDDQGRYFFVMKNLKGETLEAIIEKLKAGDPEAHRKYTFTVREQLFLGILNAVSYAHGQGIIHRDLKPANIMVGPYGEVTVMDWGLAKRIGVKMIELPAGAPIPLTEEARSTGRDVYKTQAGMIMGTPLYMSPEQARGEHHQIDQRTDTYALTVILHELMSLGHYLDEAKPVSEILQDVQTVKPSVFSMKKHPSQSVIPADIAWFVDKGLQKDPAKRFQSVAEMIARLQRGLEGCIAVQCQRTALKRVLHEVSRSADAHPVAVMAGGMAAIGLFMAALVKSLSVLL